MDLKTKMILCLAVISVCLTSVGLILYSAFRQTSKSKTLYIAIMYNGKEEQSMKEYVSVHLLKYLPEAYQETGKEQNSYISEVTKTGESTCSVGTCGLVLWKFGEGPNEVLDLRDKDQGARFLDIVTNDHWNVGIKVETKKPMPQSEIMAWVAEKCLDIMASATADKPFIYADNRGTIAVEFKWGATQMIIPDISPGDPSPKPPKAKPKHSLDVASAHALAFYMEILSDLRYDTE